MSSRVTHTRLLYCHCSKQQIQQQPCCSHASQASMPHHVCGENKRVLFVLFVACNARLESHLASLLFCRLDVSATKQQRISLCNVDMIHSFDDCLQHEEHRMLTVAGHVTLTCCHFSLVVAFTVCPSFPFIHFRRTKRNELHKQKQCCCWRGQCMCVVTAAPAVSMLLATRSTSLPRQAACNKHALPHHSPHTRSRPIVLLACVCLFVLCVPGSHTSSDAHDSATNTSIQVSVCVPQALARVCHHSTGHVSAQPPPLSTTSSTLHTFKYNEA